MGWHRLWNEAPRPSSAGSAAKVIATAPDLQRQLMREAALRNISSGAEADEVYAELVLAFWTDEEPPK